MVVNGDVIATGALLLGLALVTFVLLVINENVLSKKSKEEEKHDCCDCHECCGCHCCVEEECGCCECSCKAHCECGCECQCHDVAECTCKREEECGCCGKPLSSCQCNCHCGHKH